MLICGHQPNYLPWLGFFHKMAVADRFVLVDTVQYVGRGPFGWMHRNKIRTQDEWQWLSLPVLSKGKREQNICEAELKPMPWARKHWRAIQTNYRKAPFFEEFAGPFQAIYEQEWTHLAPLASALIRAIAATFGITTPIEVASEAGVRGDSTQLIINITRHYEGGDAYLSGVHGREYLDLALLEREGVKIVFQDYKHPTYPQHQGGEFQAGMCALDLIFNTGPEARRILMCE